MAHVQLQDVQKRFGEVIAVRNLSLSVQEGEFFSLLGPSGCGKTTTLRMLAGFETPDDGRILFGDEDVTRKKPQHRQVGMVFQNYALFPHMTVGENVAFGLRAHKVEKSSIPKRVGAALAKVELQNYADRAITALSGGQQQRVALARALVIEPAILLLDEPLSNLDARLRMETREQIRALQQQLGITTFYVTHDQEEALTQSDRIAVLLDGECVQVGTPPEIYQNPASQAVMHFIGEANFLHGILAADNQLRLNAGLNMPLPDTDISAGQKVIAGFRPQHVQLVEAGHKHALPVRVLGTAYTGATEIVRCELHDQQIRLQLPSGLQNALVAGETLHVRIPLDSLRVFADPAQ